ncbi:type II toxin-antitoxin system PemK/MazF family toxin [Calothrix sp. 336/3]|uniref:type II toxin-antitoxin system PemK/MazF family toxin n=1 Tax=Calothrix sp. 336/3 TaxID=1337936 RepID=UPI0004E39941|nr:type II toxin-antitoxin system PemK/MazF family toxin [Calothrix sp. 336/3]AKG20561.1 PemK family transcriptional regulator [Calothrix sp. 336/3]
MRRGEVWDVSLDPTEGSEQAGIRPVIIVSRDAINASSSFVLAVPCTTYRMGKRIYPSQVLIMAPDGGFERDSVAMAEQVRALAKNRFLCLRGAISPQYLQRLELALLITFDLPGQGDIE